MQGRFAAQLYDLSVSSCDKNVALQIPVYNQSVTAILPFLFDDFFRSVTPPGAMPGSNHCRFSHHFILSRQRVIKIFALAEFLADLLLGCLDGKGG
jgi:hypothetical protein